jgi:hypothetical protein
MDVIMLVLGGFAALIVGCCGEPIGFWIAGGAALKFCIGLARALG